ncbi:Uncharacterized protein OS=Anabaena variabilis (strain ATCC 29413 / PCC 7937) GN=Ava_2181 PE=4 SV=1 [Gemmata massiliana]|uniref:Tc1-like transposase DDE domain-containing protein n=1 Tax=Gemmata massiliana TaxID=1210884 RepID=A0A6P2D6K8_9BACT|nr:Uncharacterized protein OS=Anabaena variabilis (strain ATCC 29413 / PCC 7937) GN=Ava_2181 PE=4 SV=1 [Gemmata massiliana]
MIGAACGRLASTTTEAAKAQRGLLGPPTEGIQLRAAPPARAASPRAPPSRGQVPGVPAPGREDPVASGLAVAPDRRTPAPGPGGGTGRGVGHHRAGGPPPMERARAGRVDRPSGAQRGRSRLPPDQRTAPFAALKNRPSDGGCGPARRWPCTSGVGGAWSSAHRPGGAGWWTSGSPSRFHARFNVVLHFLPPCTPELQPVEPFWPIVREAVANRSIGRIDRLRAILRARLEYRTRNPSVVQPRIGFRWVRSIEQ